MTAPYWSNGVATLYQADARAIPLPDGSVHCVVTSPPYWGLRDYGLSAWAGGDPECGHLRPLVKPPSSTLVGTAGGATSSGAGAGWPNGVCGDCGAQQQSNTGIGLEPTLSDWLANIVAVSREVWRVLRDDGTYWLNLGDAYAGGGGSGRNDIDRKYAAGRAGHPEELSGLANTPHHRGDGLPAKNLMGQPWRAAFALQEDGAASVTEMYAIRRAIDAIWDAYDGERPPDKVLTVLERMHHEYVQAKGNSWYLRSAIVWHKPNPMPESVSDRPTSAYEMVFLLTKRAHYFYDAEAIRESAEYGRRNHSDGWISGQANGDGHRSGGGSVSGSDPNAGRNARNVWQIPTQGRPEAHFATFPDELPRRCILAGTSEHGVCADCGAPWARQTETAKDNGAKEPTGKAITTPRTDGHTWNENNGRGFMPVETQTVGWQPTCECNAADCPQHKPANKQDGHGPRHAGFNARWKESGGVQPKATDFQPTCECTAARVPATVLDPFIGSGTTVAVAQQLGRHGIGLDLNPDYLAIAAKRLAGISLPMAI